MTNLKIDQDLLHQQYELLCDLICETGRDEDYYEKLDGLINLIGEMLEV